MKRGGICMTILSYTILSKTVDILRGLYSCMELSWVKFCAHICNCLLENKDLFEIFDTTRPFCAARVEVELLWEVLCEYTCRTSLDDKDLFEIFDTTH